MKKKSFLLAGILGIIAVVAAFFARIVRKRRA